VGRRLDDIDRELIRRAPEGLAAHFKLMKVFGLSFSGVTRIRNGSRGLGLQNGLGSRPWQLHSRELVERWRVRQLERVEAAYRRAVEAIENNLPIPLEGTVSAPTEHLFAGIGTGGRPAVAQMKQPSDGEGWLRERRPRRR
jgi:hypothetical protein